MDSLVNLGLSFFRSLLVGGGVCLGERVDFVLLRTYWIQLSDEDKKTSAACQHFMKPFSFSGPTCDPDRNSVFFADKSEEIYHRCCRPAAR